MKIVKVFIWLGFIALLAVSIPKVAWVFRSWDGAGTLPITWNGITIDVLWLIPLFASFCIDALILAITYAVSVDKTKVSQSFMWAFACGLGAFSYFCNLLYNNAHAPTGSIWTNGFVGMITPCIISGVPLFALCYTLILSRIEGKGETLEEKATRLEQEKATKARIREATKGSLVHRFTDGAKEVILAGKEIGKELRPEKSNGRVQTPTQEVQGEQIPEAKNESKREHDGTETGSLVTLNETTLAVLDRYPNLVPLISASRRTATVKEVAEVTGYSEKWIKDRRDKKVLRASSRNTNLIVLESVISWLNSLPFDKQKEPVLAAHLPALPVEPVTATNGHH